MLRFFILVFVSGFASIENQYKKNLATAPLFQLAHIDSIYVINLPHRPERWENCKEEMDRWSLVPIRFEGIYGWDLTSEQLADVGLVYGPGMWDAKAPLLHFPLESNGKPTWLKSNETSYGKVVFNGWLTKGTIGRTLSHLSILKEAFDEGIETIWVMEDEVFFCKDPHGLSATIQALDELVGFDGWDVLYTDCDYLQFDLDSWHLPQIYHLLRPDVVRFNPQVFEKYPTYFLRSKDLNSQFMQIAGRGCTYSIIYRRSGIKKILDFYEKHRLYTDYASELGLIPDLRLFVTKENFTSVHKTPSDADEHYFPGVEGKILAPWERGEPWPN